MTGRFWITLFAAVIVTAFFVRASVAQTIPCFDIKLTEDTLYQDHDESVIGIGATFSGDLMKFFVSPGGRWTIGIVPSGRNGMLCPISYGDGFQIKKPPTQGRGRSESTAPLTTNDRSWVGSGVGEFVYGLFRESD